MKRLGAVFVERFDTVRGVEDTHALERRAGAGNALVVFAEGTFREPPGVLPFRMGAFLAAARADVPVIPVTLSGTRRLLPDLSLWPRYSKLTVTVHPPSTQPLYCATPRGQSSWRNRVNRTLLCADVAVRFG